MAEQVGVTYDPAALDAAERAFWRDVWLAAPAPLAATQGIEVRDFGPIQATMATGLADVAWINLLLGAAGAGEDMLETALDWAESLGVGFYVPVTPTAPGAAQAEALLARRGYERGYGWMKFVRDSTPPARATPPGVEVLVCDPGVAEHRAELGRIIAAGFDLPAWAAAMFAPLVEHEAWSCYLAYVEGVPAACAAYRRHDHIAELGPAATLPEARGRGAQTALLDRRIADAGAAGCRYVFVETGERVAGRVSTSYDNILGAGFQEAYVRPNWVPGAAR